MERYLTCCFTGHRPQHLGVPRGSEAETALKNRIAGEVLRLIEEQNVRHFISGMALGVDTCAAGIVLKMKELYPEVTLECALPCKGQDRHWKKADRAEYARILAAADKVTLLQDTYTPFCMQLRDAYMVDAADIVLAVWNGSKGGTAYTVNCARKRGRTIIILPPAEKKQVGSPQPEVGSQSQHSKRNTQN